MKLTKMEELKILKNNHVHYNGNLAEYQQWCASRKAKKYDDIIKLNPYQHQLYKKAIYGLKMYTAEELEKMHWKKKRHVQRITRRVQTCINMLKQERVNIMCNAIYEQLFPDSIIAKYTLSTSNIATDQKFINTLDLKSLGISKRDMINRFIKKGLLPKDFYELKGAA